MFTILLIIAVATALIVHRELHSSAYKQYKNKQRREILYALKRVRDIVKLYDDSYSAWAHNGLCSLWYEQATHNDITDYSFRDIVPACLKGATIPKYNGLWFAPSDKASRIEFLNILISYYERNNFEPSQANDIYRAC